MRVLILAPRLDCMFKEGPVPEVEGPPNDPIRVHWANLVKRLTEDHEEKGDAIAEAERADRNMLVEVSRHQEGKEAG